MSAWHYKLDDQRHGPVSFHELAALLRERTIREATLVARDGTADWQPAWHVPGLMRAAGIVEEGDSPAKASGFRVQGSATEDTPTPVLSLGEREQSALTPGLSQRESWQPLRALVAVVVASLAMGFFYRWACQATTAFPMPPTTVNGELIDCYFPIIGRCTTLECGLLYLDVFCIAVLATWHAIGRRL